MEAGDGAVRGEGRVKQVKQTKWAQMSKAQRAFIKISRAKTPNCEFGVKSRWEYNKQGKRERNRYFQLLNHWAKLKKIEDTKRAIIAATNSY